MKVDTVTIGYFLLWHKRVQQFVPPLNAILHRNNKCLSSGGTNKREPFSNSINHMQMLSRIERAAIRAPTQRNTVQF